MYPEQVYVDHPQLNPYRHTLRLSRVVYISETGGRVTEGDRGRTGPPGTVSEVTTDPDRQSRHTGCLKRELKIVV